MFGYVLKARKVNWAKSWMVCPRLSARKERQFTALRVPFAEFCGGETSPLEQNILADKSRFPDPIYNFMSLLHHTSQAGDLYDQYIANAKHAGDDELASFLEETQSAATDTAAKAKALVAAHTKSYVNLPIEKRSLKKVALLVIGTYIGRIGKKRASTWLGILARGAMSGLEASFTLWH